MPEQKVTVQNASGLHARPASLLVQAASKYACEIIIEKSGKAISAKSILGVLSLAVRKGDEICIRSNGADADQALADIVSSIQGGFGEPV
jgi:phosphotransferase system HPr (HPr) family protein